MSLREYLDQRESELIREIEVLYERLAPKQSELDEVRRAKAAIGMEVGKGTPVPLIGKRNAEGNLAIDLGADDTPKALSPYETMPISLLTIRALRDHFPSGATMAQLLKFFAETWGRRIDRQSLSPQLSRLYKRGAAGRIPSLPGWFYIPPHALEEGRHAYRHHHTKEISFKLPNQAEEQDELLWTLSTHGASPEEP